MEKEQIVKAFECCVKTKSMCDCEELGCPALTKQGCRFYLRTDEDYEGVIFVELIKEVIPLIRDQEKRIEELETSCTELTRNLHACKADTVRKMVERLKEKAIDVDTDDAALWMECVTIEDVNQIAKEILEENT